MRAEQRGGGSLTTMTSAAASSSRGPQREQLGIARADTDEGHSARPYGRLLRTGRLRLSRRSAAAGLFSRGSRCALPHQLVGPLGDHLGREIAAQLARPLQGGRFRTSGSVVHRRTRQRPPIRCSVRSSNAAYAPTGRRAARPRGPRAGARSAVTAARVAGSSSVAENLDQVGTVGPALEGQRALAGRGQHLAGSKISETASSRLIRARPAKASTTASNSPVGDLAQPRVGVAADRHDVQVGAERAQLRHPARRSGADPGARAAGRPAWPAAGRRRASRGSSRRRDRGQRDALGRQRRQVLQRVHGEVDLAGQEPSRAAR